MNAVLGAFKLQSFDLEPVLAAWTDAPRFNGNPKKDLPVDQWLKEIKAGCVQRRIPSEYWHKVAQHYMGSKARARLDELKAVIAKVQGAKYRWNWKKFKVAMMNMGWSIDASATETIKVSKTGSWFSRSTRTSEPAPAPAPPSTAPVTTSTTTRTRPSRSNSLFQGWTKVELEEEPLPLPPTTSSTKPKASRKNSDSSFWPPRRNSSAAEKPPASSSHRDRERESHHHHHHKESSSSSKDSKDKDKTVTPLKRPTPVKSKTDSGIVATLKSTAATAAQGHVAKLSSSSSHNSGSHHKSHSPERSSKHDKHDKHDKQESHEVVPAAAASGEVSTITNAPVWLLNAVNALDFITSEHPKTMSVISAILITAGSIPAIPAITAGAGGAVLASSAAQAVGALAVGLGQALNQTMKNRDKETTQQEAHGSSHSR